MASRGNDKRGAEETPDPGYFAYEGLNRVLHEKARLGILTALRTHADGLAFADLKAMCSLTDGNLSRHLAVLQEASLVAIKKGVHGRRPLTEARLTARGRKEFDAYIAELQRVIQDASVRVKPAGENSAGRNPDRNHGRNHGGDAPGVAPA